MKYILTLILLMMSSTWVGAQTSFPANATIITAASCPIKIGPCVMSIKQLQSQDGTTSVDLDFTVDRPLRGRIKDYTIIWSYSLSPKSRYNSDTFHFYTNTNLAHYQDVILELTKTKPVLIWTTTHDYGRSFTPIQTSQKDAEVNAW